VINRHLDDALVKGAKIIAGGHVKLMDGGYWGEPTIVINVNHSMLLMTEETFGPIIPVMAYSEIEEAVEWANDSEYGLSAAVFSGDVDQALKIAQKIEAGAVSINGTGYGTAAIGEGNDLEKNAFKNSGLAGSRLGYDSIFRFMRKKSYLINRSN
jgi:succinate-semialdehyde dehydrogenase/glutarate-semialdehyde dehydrogenase